MTELTVEDWIKRGYKRYEISDRSREINKLADFMLQKRFDDDRGKKYSITVYCYDRSRYPGYMQGHMPEVGFMPTVQFTLGDNRPFFNIEMNAVKSIDEVEKYFEFLWFFLAEPFREKDNG